MCGLVGYLGGSGSLGESDHLAALKRMSDRIATRGPDGEGQWADAAARIGLAHRRLAVVDLSSAGQQPMRSVSDRYVLSFNGEIYNHLALRRQLAGNGEPSAWRGHSDTETLLACFDAWGVEKTLQAASGMFAFALWDRHERVLSLARDRMGEKPLYYGWQGSGEQAVFLFGSELKALRAHPAFAGEVDRDVLTLQLRHNYIPAPHSIYQGVSKLLPGSWLELRQTDIAARRLPEPRQYWSAICVAASGCDTPHVFTSDDDAVDHTERVLLDAIRGQMVADVPLGAFLSGGVDSSTVVALMQSQSSRPVKTFSIGFEDGAYDEAPYAKDIARHLGTDHTELYVSPSDAMAVIPRLPQIYDEPFSDSSQIPTYLVSQLARNHVTVSLSGDAGDELFCGYNRYLLTSRLWPRLSATPLCLRRIGSRVLTSLSPEAWNQLLDPLKRLLPSTLRLANLGDTLHKAAPVLQSRSFSDLYLGLVSHWDNPASVVLGATEPETPLTREIRELIGMGDVQKMMLLDMLTYLPDDILAKVDRAAMAVSLESRVPFLDHRVVEFAGRLPMKYKFRDGQSKWALRQVLYRYVPRKLIERPKMGFGVPLGAWLRGPLREWAGDFLEESRLRREGFFDPIAIRTVWNEHLSGVRNWQYHLWDVLMFQAWLGQARRY